MKMPREKCEEMILILISGKVEFIIILILIPP